MADSRNKLKGDGGSKTPLIVTFLIFGLIALFFILYGSYAYLGYVRTNNIASPGMNEVLKAFETWFSADSFKLPLTGDVIKEIFVLQVKELWWVYLAIVLLVFMIMTSGNKNDFKGVQHGSARWANKYEKKRFSDDTGIPCGDNFYLTVTHSKNCITKQTI